ncbi:MAG: putative bifunctional diguanylate cyclase/phosphodiesterase [Actinomycetota bacterium]
MEDADKQQSAALTHALADRPASSSQSSRNRSVRSLLLTIVIAASVFVSVTSAIFLWISFDRGREAALDRVNAVAADIATDLSKSVAEAQKAVEGAAPSLGPVLAAPAGCQLTSSSVGVFESAQLHLVDERGAIVCSSLAGKVPLPSLAYADVEWMRRLPTARQTIVSEPFDDELGGTRSIAVATPIRDGERYQGAFLATLPTDNLVKTLIGGSATRRGVDVVIVDRRSAAIISGSEAPASNATAKGTPFASRRAGEWRGMDGRDRFYSAVPIERFGWDVYAGVQSSVVLAGARRDRLAGIVATILLVVLLVVLGSIVNRRIAKPLRSLSVAIAEAANHALPAGVVIQGPAEVTGVADRFNELLEARTTYEETLVYQSSHDSLTGLPNRVLMSDRLRQALERDSEAERIAVLFIDLDHFSSLNQSLGHSAGDIVLTTVATRLTEAARPGETVARFGADEFVVVSEGIDGPSHAVGIVERIRRAVVAAIDVGASTVSVTASVGVVLNRGGAEATEDLLRDAAAAMHRAKQQGIDRVEIFDETLRARLAQRISTETDLRTALQRDELFIHHQPKVDLRTGRIVGTEALVRWRHPTRGIVPPGEFIAVAEESGLIEPLGRHVLALAARDAVELQGRSDHPISVAVNVSAVQMVETLPEVVEATIAKAGADTRMIGLELTESSLLGDPASATPILRGLKAMGHTLSLDDFGTGYSSLSYLRRYPIDELKIDQSFVGDMGIDGEDALITSIIAMGRALHLQVVAEGVEKPEQLRTLAALGCNTAQGYLLARPQPLADVVDLAKEGFDLRTLSVGR